MCHSMILMFGLEPLRSGTQVRSGARAANIFRAVLICVLCVELTASFLHPHTHSMARCSEVENVLESSMGEYSLCRIVTA